MRKMEFWGLRFGLLYFLTYSFTKTRLFVGLKTWPHSHLPVSDVSEYPPSPSTLSIHLRGYYFLVPSPARLSIHLRGCYKLLIIFLDGGNKSQLDVNMNKLILLKRKYMKGTNGNFI